MNKKNLSVVMAGAMLATSVAPVLADTTTETKKDYEVNGSNKGLLIKELENLVNGSTFANVDDNGTEAGKSVYYVKNDRDIVVSSKTILRDSFTGSNAYDKYIDSVNKEIERINKEYGFSIPKATENASDTHTYVKGLLKCNVVFNNTAQKNYQIVVKIPANSILDTNTAIETAIQSAANETVFTVWDRGHVEKDGKFYAFDAPVFTEDDFEWVKNNEASLLNLCKSIITDFEVSDDNKTLTVKTRLYKDNTPESQEVFTYKAGESKSVYFETPLNKAGESMKPDFDADGDGVKDYITDYESFGGFKEKPAENIADKKLYTITISDSDKVFNVTLPELYDGLFLTDKGQELVDTMKEYDSKGYYVRDYKTRSTSEFEVQTDESGLYFIEIEFEKPVPGINKSTKQKVVITSKNYDQMVLFAKGIKRQPSTEGATRKFPVQVLEGSNRYETAVKVAKENADITTVAENGNIVLVNGRSLVDGLAAAPLAASVWNKDNDAFGGSDTDFVAPILLTEANGIPKETKDYMKELIGEQQIKNLDKITVYLVGGETVISKAVENDLKEIGFRVVRAGGEDREETSLKVAELMHKDTQAEDKEQAFLVGAHGEADAMSIASVAAATKTPIIVESVHGIKEDTVNYLKGYKNTDLDGKKVTIIGGEGVVSKATENTLIDEKLSVERLFGDNRKETNAKIIDNYYGVGSDAIYAGHKFNNVVISKDGMNNPDELIDALTATSLAVRDKAPIVLATKSLDKTQVNALYKNASGEGLYVYQVGGNNFVRDIVQEIAAKIGLAK